MTIIFELEHFRFDLGNPPDPLIADVDDEPVRIGVFSTKAKAEHARDLARQDPRFAHWPNGFSIGTTRTDHDYWQDGFINPMNDEDWYGEHVPSPEQPRYDDPEHLPPALFEVIHTKTGPCTRPGIDMATEDMEPKPIGLYTSATRAEEAIARARSKPGFRDWPEGFQIIEVPIDPDTLA